MQPLLLPQLLLPQFKEEVWLVCLQVEELQGKEAELKLAVEMLQVRGSLNYVFRPPNNYQRGGSGGHRL